MFSAGAGVFFPEPEFFLPEPEPEVKNPEFAQHYKLPLLPLQPCLRLNKLRHTCRLICVDAKMVGCDLLTAATD